MQSYHSQEEENTGGGGDSDWLEDSEDDFAEEQKVAGKGEGQITLSMAEKETEKVQRKMYDDGYREGIGLGKEGAIQLGFDHGFKANGAPIGRRMGKLKGTLHALEIRLIQSRASKESTSNPSSSEKLNSILQSTKTLRHCLNSLQLKDLMEPDWEAIEHECQHGGQVDHIKPETPEQKSKREGILAEIEEQVNKLVLDSYGFV
ncbi:uncharacterized protein FA14DRAFT_186984 [Meira miltonrushii]|uniref:Protein yae1 n=1 Tax=Meira miltonrushii TaxID=1280837 RepID=A0A316VGZ0_9BASI|nr:uncharacterized protein FA14DRAFT_186984 [Meira miltonrushii]PWN36806.1 hypothetical protein FA14DRAFT_186984 [Meira miltonrushii]